MNLENVLLEGWEGWEGSGVYDIPGKNVILTDGTEGSILIDNEGIVVYNVPLDILNDGQNDMGMSFIELAETAEETTNLKNLSEQDILESKIMFNRYLELQSTTA